MEDSQPPPITANHLARCFFQEDLKAHETIDGSQGVELTVVLHDACYGHRYARPKTSKANLSTIVERPERVKATVMGLAAAYVRLGERYAEGRYSPQTQRQPKMPIPFALFKSSRQVSLTDSVVMNVHGSKWMQDLTTMCKDAESKLALNGKELVRPSSESNNTLPSEKAKLHEGDLYLCVESLDALEGSLGAVCDAIDRIFSSSITKRAFVAIRPPGHHCSADYPSGFCWINNVHVGISYAAQAHGLTHAAILDFDLHHGDGSQAITWAHNTAAQRLPKNASAFKKTSIGYFSLHDINSYPCEYGDEQKVQNASLCIENAHGQTIWNTHLQPWKNDSEFWHLYHTRYSVLIEKARAFLLHHNMRCRQSASQLSPKAAIFISAGFDASEWEGSGMQRHKVNVPTEFYARFTQDIVDLANEDGLGVAGRVISVLEGGYSDRALSSGVLSHVCGLASYKKQENSDLDLKGLSQEIASRLGNFRIDKEDKSTSPFDSHWWSLECLEELENVGKAPQPVIPIKKPPNGLAPTYTSPTQASTAKAVSPLLPRRSTSGSIAASLQRSTSSASSRPPSPPCLEVDWATAASELCSLLVPTNRSTTSHRHEELNAQATRARKDRQSILLPVDEATTPNAKRMQLRDRKSKATQSKQVERETTTIPKSNRRKTIADATSLATESHEGASVFKPAARTMAKAPMRRRSSIASTAISTIEENSLTEPQDLSCAEVLEVGRKLSSSTLEPCSRPPEEKGHDLLVHKRGRPAQNAVPTTARPKKGATERPPAVSRVSSSQTKRGSTQPASSNLPTQDERASVGPIAPADADIDSLVSGVKRINLKLKPPKKPDQDTARVPKKAPTSRAPRKAAQTMPPKEQGNRTDASAFMEPNMALPPQTDEEPREVTISTNNAAKISAKEIPSHSENEELQAPIQEHSPPAPPPFIPAFTAPNGPAITATADGLENASPFTKVVDGEPILSLASSTTSPSTPLATLVNHQVTSPKRTKTELPIFTSTGPILFAPQDRDTASMDKGFLEHPSADRMRRLEEAMVNARDIPAPMLKDEEAAEPSVNHEGTL